MWSPSWSLARLEAVWRSECRLSGQMPECCPLCTSPVNPFQHARNTIVFNCTNVKCPWPMMYLPVSEWQCDGNLAVYNCLMEKRVREGRSFVNGKRQIPDMNSTLTEIPLQKKAKGMCVSLQEHVWTRRDEMSTQTDELIPMTQERAGCDAATQTESKKGTAVQEMEQRDAYTQSMEMKKLYKTVHTQVEEMQWKDAYTQSLELEPVPEKLHSSKHTQALIPTEEQASQTVVNTCSHCSTNWGHLLLTLAPPASPSCSSGGEHVDTPPAHLPSPPESFADTFEAKKKHKKHKKHKKKKSRDLYQTEEHLSNVDSDNSFSSSVMPPPALDRVYKAAHSSGSDGQSLPPLDEMMNFPGPNVLISPLQPTPSPRHFASPAREMEFLFKKPIYAPTALLSPLPQTPQHHNSSCSQDDFSDSDLDLSGMTPVYCGSEDSDSQVANIGEPVMSMPEVTSTKPNTSTEERTESTCHKGNPISTMFTSSEMETSEKCMARNEKSTTKQSNKRPAKSKQKQMQTNSQQESAVDSLEPLDLCITTLSVANENEVEESMSSSNQIGASSAEDARVPMGSVEVTSVIPAPQEPSASSKHGPIGNGNRVVTFTYENCHYGPIFLHTDEEVKAVKALAKENIEAAKTRGISLSTPQQCSSAAARARSLLPPNIVKYLDQAFTQKGLKENTVGRKSRNYPKRSQIIKVDKNGIIIGPANHPMIGQKATKSPGKDQQKETESEYQQVLSSIRDGSAHDNLAAKLRLGAQLDEMLSKTKIQSKKTVEEKEIKSSLMFVPANIKSKLAPRLADVNDTANKTPVVPIKTEFKGLGRRKPAATTSKGVSAEPHSKVSPNPAQAVIPKTKLFKLQPSPANEQSLSEDQSACSIRQGQMGRVQKLLELKNRKVAKERHRLVKKASQYHGMLQPSLTSTSNSHLQSLSSTSSLNTPPHPSTSTVSQAETDVLAKLFGGVEGEPQGTNSNAMTPEASAQQNLICYNTVLTFDELML